MYNNLPQGWVERELKDVFDVITGKTPSKKQPEFFGGDIPFVKPGDLDKEKFIYYTEEDSLTDKGFKNAPFLPKYSVLVSCIGNLGKKAILGVDGSCNQQINAILPNKYVDYKYVYYYINKIIYWMKQNASATTVTILNKSKFEQAPFLLPPLNEQKRIVKTIEEKFAKIDNGIEKLKIAQEQIVQYKQTVLNFYYKKDSSGYLCKLNDILKYKQPTKHIVKSTKYDNLYKTPVLTAGKSFIIGYTNETTGICNELPVIIFDDFTTSSQFVDFPFKVKSSAMKILYSTKEANIKYLYYYMQTIQHKAHTHKRYWISEYSQRKIFLPSFDEQAQVVKEIEKRFEVADKAEKVIINNLDKAQLLKQSILKKAFEGRLVPQNPNDEPASVLLEKIKTERGK